jgi:cytochrome P450
MLFTDPPQHSRLRRLASRAFIASRVRALRPIVERMIEELIHEALERREIELMDEVAHSSPSGSSASSWACPRATDPQKTCCRRS